MCVCVATELNSINVTSGFGGGSLCSSSSRNPVPRSEQGAAVRTDLGCCKGEASGRRTENRDRRLSGETTRAVADLFCYTKPLTDLLLSCLVTRDWHWRMSTAVLSSTLRFKQKHRQDLPSSGTLRGVG